MICSDPLPRDPRFPFIATAERVHAPGVWDETATFPTEERAKRYCDDQNSRKGSHKLFFYFDHTKVDATT